MDVLAVKQACKFAKEHAIANGPIVSTHDFFYSIILSMHYGSTGLTEVQWCC